MPTEPPNSPIFAKTRDFDSLLAVLLASWTPEQLDYMHDIDWWCANIAQTGGVDILDMREMACTREAWADWIACDNEYAAGDRAAVEAGALDYLNTIADGHGARYRVEQAELGVS